MRFRLAAKAAGRVWCTPRVPSTVMHALFVFQPSEAAESNVGVQAVRQPRPALDEERGPQAELYFYSMQFDHTRMRWEDCWLPGDEEPGLPARWEVGRPIMHARMHACTSTHCAAY